MTNKITLLDGAMGTELRNRGCTVPSHLDSIWSAQVLIDSPDTVREVHRDYILAGADIIIANNYAVTHDLLERVNRQHQLTDLTELAVDLADQARSASGRQVRIAGSLPPLNTSYRADLVGSQASIIRKYSELLEVLVPNTDLIIIESMASAREAMGALEACRAFDHETWLSFTLHGNRRNTLPSGESLSEAINAVSEFSFEALLINCCAINQLTEALHLMTSAAGRPYGGYANPEVIHTFSEKAGVDTDPETAKKDSATTIDIPRYLAAVQDWLTAGATIVGGCCRTSPEHIQQISAYLDSREKP